MGDKTIEEPIVVGVLSSAEPLSYTTFLLALLHLTHSGAGQRILPFLISTRNSPLAVAHLITTKKVKYLWNKAILLRLSLSPLSRTSILPETPHYTT
ncbi:hypothetical protein M422DRAFT_276213 [Sphaerobolus stellatus SS14]|uniref:Uncharacterized protein n=1 Tax=Sphaerobolus stellatus (strain SS14) TaxID=990650 RepID=A0A0C9UCP3_SPHS4|nr:hypothetical protein M422DRAFT_276213 [Sphaerobolus stellatus SS14]